MAISVSKAKASKLSGPSGRDSGGPQADGLDTSVDRKAPGPYVTPSKPKNEGNGGQSPNQFSGKRVRGG